MITALVCTDCGAVSADLYEVEGFAFYLTQMIADDEQRSVQPSDLMRTCSWTRTQMLCPDCQPEDVREHVEPGAWTVLTEDLDSGSFDSR